MNKKLSIIILAAGKSTRMKSGLPKPLHPICGRPMLEYVLDLVGALKPQEVVAVLGHKHEEVKKIIPGKIKIALQKRLLGTADAVRAAMPLLKNFSGATLILYADNPLLNIESIKKLISQHTENQLEATLLTANVDKPVGYGRIVRDEYSSICRIVEDKDADEVQKDIKEINTGIMCFDHRRLASSLKQIKPNNLKKEYYLTDAIEIIYKKGGLIDNVKLSDINEALGINSRIDLSKANAIMQKKINEEFTKNGVTIIDPESVFINYGTKIGQDTTIYPFTVIEKGVKIGKRCQIGPFAHLRETTVINDEVIVGNFLEIARSNLGSKTIVKHFGYVGDSRIGKSVNIGAGVVTANFDGKDKNITTIKNNAFIGSDTILVAPVEVGRFAKTGAGAVLVKHARVANHVTVVGIPAKQIKRG